MCLYSKTNKMLKAEKDIVCYKFLLKKERTLCTPFMGEEIKKLPHVAYGKVNEEKELKILNKDNIFQSDKKSFTHSVTLKDEVYYEVDDGFIHAFQTEKDCIEALNEYVFWNPHNFVFIAKCIIPKGAGYFKGKFNDICATQMKIGVE